ncbi:hypothetical protein GOBAR_DD16951 [Gossypium barbadense]|nr:hypothetical protein GOBAR_DD16951 [Gossypium barbadense]
MKGIRSILIAFGLFAFACSSASAYDPSPLQDFCVAVKDFKNGDGSNVTMINVDQILGLNTLSISLVRIGYAPYGRSKYPPGETHTFRSYGSAQG